MTISNKYSKTGSNPFYLNLQNTAKDFSFQETTNPLNSLLDTLPKHILIINSFEVKQPIIQKEIIIEDIHSVKK